MSINHDHNQNTKLIIWFSIYLRNSMPSYEENQSIVFENYNGYMNFKENQIFNYEAYMDIEYHYFIKKIIFALNKDKPCLNLYLENDFSHEYVVPMVLTDKN